MEQIIYDIGIIGAGPAGMTAAIYAARANKTVVILDKNGFGGNIASSPLVENIPGFESISGADFAEKMFNQMSAYSNVTFALNEVIFTDYYKGLIKMTLDDRSLVCCKSLIIATGTEHKSLSLATEHLHYCVTCDGPLYKDKAVLVVGSGNTGATYALELATYCKHVYLCDVTKDLCCEAVLKNKILNNSKITWLAQSAIKSIKSDKNGNLMEVLFTNYNTIRCRGIFAAIGMEPKTSPFQRLVPVDQNKFIIADESCTIKAVPNIFVAGDCRTKSIRQVATAVSDGAVAATKAIMYLNK